VLYGLSVEKTDTNRNPEGFC